jgi:hypothetical protein
MAYPLSDVYAPGCAGDFFYGYGDCPNCKAPIAFTISTGFEVICPCGQLVKLPHGENRTP